MIGTVKIQEGTLTGSLVPQTTLSCSVSIPDTVYVESPEMTYILTDDFGNEAVAVVTEDRVTLDATPNDIRLGTTAATCTGVTPGTKVIPSYHTRGGFVVILKGKTFELTRLDEDNLYDFTKLQAIICEYNTNSKDSVSSNKVCINENVYNVNSTDSISSITKNHNTKTVEFGITNDSDKIHILRFFTYKEIN